MKLFKKSYKNYKRAVSPVIAVVLLIALTVAAGAVIWAISSGLLDSNTTRFVVEEYGVGDTNSNDIGDLVRLQIRNIGSNAATIEYVKVFRDGSELGSWVLLEEYSFEPGEVGFIEFQTLVTLDEISSQNDVSVEFGNSEGTITIYDISVPSALSSLPVLYDASQGFSGVDLTADGWTSHTYGTHGGGGSNIYVENGDIVFDTNDDILYYLLNDNQKVENGVITANFLYGDNDGIGVAFRIVDELNYYWVGITEDHNGPQNRAGHNSGSYNGPWFVNDGHFEIHKIVDGTDTILDNKVSTTFSVAPGTPSNPSGPYSLRITLFDDTLVFEAREGNTGSYEEIFTIVDDTFLEEGYVGVFSQAAKDTRLDNFTVTG